MKSAPQSWIMFHKPGFELAEAVNAFARTNLFVTQQGETLLVRWNDHPTLEAGPTLQVHFLSGTAVQDEAVALSKRSNAKPYASVLLQCDSRFVISFDNLEVVLDEINTLIEVQATLQEATDGILYNNWNKQISQ
ncbi:MAG: hypothetical protein M3Y56_12220 [Armatimonadota bacterium]|nr:hypothetical protein [Armatimonadota bacterium]